MSTTAHRSQQKCLIASLMGHGLLIGLVLAGGAFFSRTKTPESLPKLKFMPSILIDEMLAGGGGDPSVPQIESATPLSSPPIASVEVPAPTRPQVPPEPTPPPKTVKTTPIKKAEIKPAPVKPEPPKPVLDPPKTATATPAPKVEPAKKPQVEIDPTRVVVRNSEEQRRKAQEEATRKKREDQERREQEAAAAASKAAVEKRLNALQSSVKSLTTDFANDKGVQVQVMGGPGGEAYGNYGAFVWERYKSAWIPPTLVDAGDTTVEVVVTIVRSGDVLNARITKRSGVVALDKSVETAIARVKKVAPFPDSSKDEQRSFTIPFNLKAKNQSG